jgi:hypothetical protein
MSIERNILNYAQIWLTIPKRDNRIDRFKPSDANNWLGVKLLN